MPVVTHRLIGDKINRVLLQTPTNDSFESLEILLLEEDLVAGIAAIERMVDRAAIAGAKRTRHEKLREKIDFAYPKKHQPVKQPILPKRLLTPFVL